MLAGMETAGGEGLRVTLRRDALNRDGSKFNTSDRRCGGVMSFRNLSNSLLEESCQ